MAELQGAAGEADAYVGAPAEQDPIDAIVDEMLPDEDEEEGEEPGFPGSEGDGDDADDEGADSEAASGIDPPASWKADEKEFFKTLPRGAQEVLARREAERDRFIQSKAQEAAHARSSAEREALAQLEQLSTRYARHLNFTLPHVPERPSYQLQIEDPIAFAEQMDAHEFALAQHHQVQQQIHHAETQATNARQLLQLEEAQEFQAVLAQEFPEFLEPSNANLRQELGAIAIELGYPADQLPNVNATDVLAMRKAAEWKAKADKFDALNRSKMESVRAAKSLPRPARPGAAPTRAQAGAQSVQSSWERAKKTRSPSDFADYLTKAGLI